MLCWVSVVLGEWSVFCLARVVLGMIPALGECCVVHVMALGECCVVHVMALGECCVVHDNCIR